MTATKHKVNFLKRELRQRILSGDLPVGSRVPSEAQLVQQSGATRSQARKALRELENDGLLSRKRGSGSYVLPVAAKQGRHSAGEQDTVRIALPEFGSRYVRLVLEGFMERMFADGLKVVTTYENFSNAYEEAAFINLLGHMDMAGVAMWILNDTKEVREALTTQRQQGLPIILFDRCIPGVDTDLATSDNESIGYELCQTLLERGHRRIGFVSSEGDTAHTIIERYEGYNRALTQAGIPLDERMIVHLDNFGNNHRTEVNAVMAYRERPTAFVCVNDCMTEWLEGELDRLGWSAEQGIEIACVADCEPRKGGLLPTFYIRQDGHEIGHNCAELLLSRIKNPSDPVQHRLSQPGPVQFEGPTPQEGGEHAEESTQAAVRSRSAHRGEEVEAELLHS